MKILIIGGFLGSGKTTALIQLAEHLRNTSRKNNSSIQTPVVILENEVSDVGIDNRFLSQSGFQVREMLSGCICCSSSAQLTDTVTDIQKEYCPDWLIVEATGLAYPDAIQETLRKELKVDAKIIALLDASRWIRLTKAMPQFAFAQIVHADVILVNKTDLVESNQLADIQASLAQCSVSAYILEVSMLHPKNELFWTDILKGLEANHA